jgi:hypothetical protein
MRLDKTARQVQLFFHTFTIFSAVSPLNRKMIIRSVILHSWFQANSGNRFCARLKKGDSHLRHSSLICTVQWLSFLAPTQVLFSPTYWLKASTLGLCTPQTFSLLRHAPPRLHPFRLAQTIFEPKRFLYKYPTISSPLFCQGIDAKTGHGPHPRPAGAAASPKRLIIDAYPLGFSQSGLTPQTANQPKFIPPTINSGPFWRKT